MTFEFGPYRLEVATRRLLRNGEAVPLQPKAFDVLVALIERRDRVVDKAELMQLVWPDSFVEEANLTQTIFVLRKTLGSDASGADYIETVPRRGYRFAAGVTHGATAPALAARSKRRVLTTAAAAIAITIVALGMWRFSTARSGARFTETTRLVVLPFENLSGAADDAWLSSAFSDSLTSGLQGVEHVVLVSRDRIVELYRLEGIKPAEAIDAGALRRVATSLDVRHVVHGSYQRVGDDIKVIARLIAADTGAITAQESVTARFATLLTVEDDLAGRFASQLQGSDHSTPGSPATDSIEAYRAVVESRTMYSESRFADAVAPLTRATTLDPDYADAWAMLAKVHARRATISMLASGAAEQFRRDALQAAERAVSLQPSLYDAHLALALAYREMEDFERWRAESRKAIELNPRIAEAHELLADSYFAGNAWGCKRDRNAPIAEESFRTAIALDPRLPQAYANFSYHFSWSVREADGLRVADDGLARLPGNAIVTRARALALIRLNRLDEAEGALRQLLAKGAAMSAQDHLMFGMIALARRNHDLATQEFDTAAARLPTSAFRVAIARAFFDNGHVEEGVAHLDRAIAIEPSCTEFAATSPAFAPYRNHLRR
jgi:DNA-binding winged helix-turn-helix (wHTH) protein/TolB-like protein/tetratricopeptide (TPR) repeat protein